MSCAKHEDAEDHKTESRQTPQPFALSINSPSTEKSVKVELSSLSKSVTVQRASAPVTFYRKPLPESCIAFSSKEGKKIFTEALATGHMNCYFPLASQFRTQDEPAYCGLSTLIMVLNALEIDPGRVWKGPWKWYHEDMLDCCVPPEIVQEKGITFDEFICIADCNSIESRALRVDESCNEEDFRQLVKDMTLRDDSFLIASYSRPMLGQTGDGHFAPVSGYHPGRDLVLILDTARFKYPPHWVTVSALFQSMKAVDKSTGLPRGYIQVWPAKDSKALLLFKVAQQFSVNASPEIVENYQQFLLAWVQLLAGPLPAAGEDSLPLVVGDVLRGLIDVACTLDKETFVLTTQEHISCTTSCNVQCVIQDLLKQIEASSLFKAVCEHVTTMAAEDLAKLENIFGTWPNVGPPRADLMSKQKCKPDQAGACCDLKQFLCLCHFVTTFLLCWPYSSSQAAGTLGSALEALSQDMQQGSFGEIVKDEMCTLHRQLSKLTGYHSPAQSPKAEVSKRSCSSGGQCKTKCKKGSCHPNKQL